MKKRWIPLILLLALLTACRAPWGKEEKPIRPMTFYYAASEDADYTQSIGGLYAEEVDLGMKPHTVADILNFYFRGPVHTHAASPFPSALTVMEYEQKEGLLTLRVNEVWSRMSGPERQLAQACLVLTLTQLSSVDAVCIYSQGEPACEPMGAEDYLLYDDSATSDQVMVKLYFSDPNGRYLVEETRSRSFSGELDQLTYVVEEMLQGPENEGSLAVIPQGVNLLELRLEQGVCTLNLSEAFYSDRPKTHGEARMVVFSLVNALTEQAAVESVRLLCVGRPMEDYGGLDLSQPLQREETALGQNKGAANQEDSTLYLPCGQSGKLAAVPIHIRHTAGRSRAESVMNALLTFEPANGYENPFPDGTVVTELSIRGSVCHVTFNSAFGLCDADPVQAQQAVRSVVTTLCAMDGIDQVQINVTGVTMTQADLSAPLSPDQFWVLP